jgi:hypothetical protein
MTSISQNYAPLLLSFRSQAQTPETMASDSINEFKQWVLNIKVKLLTCLNK